MFRSGLAVWRSTGVAAGATAREGEATTRGVDAVSGDALEG